MKYLQHIGYKIFPINPNLSDRKILGETVYDKIGDIQNDIDIVNVFRPSDKVITIAKQAIKKKAKTLWLQLDIISPKSKLIVESEGINFIENKCTKIEHEKFLR
jgi:predicted CoA-binding protein